MKLKVILRGLFPSRRKAADPDERFSMVLLLRKPHFFHDNELRSAAEKAWGISFSGGKGSMHCVIQSGTVTLMKAGPHLLNFFHHSKPYVDNSKTNVDWLPQASQRQAWAEHTACVGVDYMNRNTDVELSYCVLAKLVAEMLDENCAGIYVPRENSLIPHDKSLYGELQKIASARNAGILLPS
jgi:hypothetical protein